MINTLKSFITPQTLDIILSDPLLLIGACLIVLGALLFLFSFVKFLRSGQPKEFIVPHHPIDDEVQPQHSEELTNGGGKGRYEPTAEEPPHVLSEPEPEPMAESHHEPETPEPAHGHYAEASDRTMVVAPEVAELQAQFEIAITQIKQLNKKIFDLERQIQGLESRSDSKLEPNELKEPPMDPNDFTKKLLKVVEHVIVLEKEVARLRGKSEPQETGSASSTVMPV